MRHHILAAVWLAFAPFAAHAQTHCDAIIPLAQIHAALERVAAPGHRNVDADLVLVRRTLLRVDGDSLRFALRGHALTSQVNRFDALLRLGQHSRTDSSAQAIRRVTTPQARQLLYSVGQALRPYPCRGAVPSERRGLQQLQSTGLTAPTTIGITQRTAMITLALSIILVFLCIYIIRRQIRRLAEKRRREKRFYVRIRTQLSLSKKGHGETPAAPEPIQIVDISCAGAKVLHTLSLEPGEKPTVEVTLEGKAHPATVVWQNNHFAGLKFHKRLGYTMLRKLVRNHRPRSIDSKSSNPAQI